MSCKLTIRDQFIGRISVNMGVFFKGKEDFFPLMMEARFFDGVNIRKDSSSLYWVLCQIPQWWSQAWGCAAWLCEGTQGVTGELSGLSRCLVNERTNESLSSLSPSQGCAMISYGLCGCKSVFLKAPHNGGLREDKKVVLKMEIVYSRPYSIPTESDLCSWGSGICILTIPALQVTLQGNKL